LVILENCKKVVMGPKERGGKEKNLIQASGEKMN
jgi:hypothetical protein